VNENIFGKRLPWEDEISNHADFQCRIVSKSFCTFSQKF